MTLGSRTRNLENMITIIYKSFGFFLNNSRGMNIDVYDDFVDVDSYKNLL